MDKDFWKMAVKQFGIGIVFAVMLIGYYSAENHKWEVNSAQEQERWETLLQKYSEDQKQSMDAIRTCCMESHRR
jgi:hypothetical protein